MKLLMTTDTIGGVWTYAIDLARALAAYRVEIALATMGAPLSPSQRRDVDACANVTLHESNFKLEWMDDPWGDVAAAGKWLLDLEQQVAPDLVHLNGYAHASLPFVAPIIVVAHSCVLSWWRAVKGETAPPSWNRYRDAVASGLDDAAVVVAPTHAMLQALEEIYLPLRNKRVIPNGRDASLYRPGRKESFVLTAGRLWDEAKNVWALAQVAPQLDWPVCVAGEQRHPSGTISNGPQDVLPLGQLTPRELANWMSRADIYALPARYEPFGLSALEAALSGCALVLGDIPSLREVWGDTAIYVTPQDSHELLDQLQALIDNAQIRANLARRARHRAAQYSLTRMGDAYHALYQQTCRRRALADADFRIADAFTPHARI
jgi:glycosyltransferase involved in cell wall biosynthesis